MARDAIDRFIHSRLCQVAQPHMLWSTFIAPIGAHGNLETNLSNSPRIRSASHHGSSLAMRRIDATGSASRRFDGRGMRDLNFHNRQCPTRCRRKRIAGLTGRKLCF